jgi:predicted O-methyltransferase YrrM
MEPEVIEVLTALEEQADRNPLHPDSARFLHVLALGAKARSIVEVGTGQGYSTLWLASAAKINGGRVLTCEIDPAVAEEARQNLDRAGLSELVEVLVGDARDVLRTRDLAVDLLFIDAERGFYETFFDVVYKKMETGALAVADDVVDYEDELADYVTYVQNHPSLESATVPLGQGLELSVKIK